MNENDKFFKRVVIAWCIGAALVAAFWITVAIIAIHFIHKFW